MELSGNNLKKCGDLDSHAHQNTNKFPTYVLEEIEIVNKAPKLSADSETIVNKVYMRSRKAWKKQSDSEDNQD